MVHVRNIFADSQWRLCGGQDYSYIDFLSWLFIIKEVDLAWPYFLTIVLNAYIPLIMAVNSY